MMNGEQLLSQQFVKSHSVDAARILEQLPVEKTVGFLMEIPFDLAANVVNLMAPSIAVKCLESLDIKKAAAIIERLPIEVAAVLLRWVEELKRLAILKILPDEIVESFGLMLQYPENTAGALIDLQVFTLFDDLTVKEALEQIRRHPKYVFYHIPVINREHIFLGLINIRELMLSEPEVLIASVMHTGVGQLSPTANREAILAHPDWRTYHDLPVVNEKGVFLGLISYQIVRRLEDEIHKSARSRPVYDAGKALGELYWMGMSAFLKGAASVINHNKKSK